MMQLKVNTPTSGLHLTLETLWIFPIVQIAIYCFGGKFSYNISVLWSKAPSKTAYVIKLEPIKTIILYSAVCLKGTDSLHASIRNIDKFALNFTYPVPK